MTAVSDPPLPTFDQVTATVTCWRIPLNGFPATSTCEATTVDADRATSLLAAGPMAGRDWRDLTRAEEDGDE